MAAPDVQRPRSTRPLLRRSLALALAAALLAAFAFQLLSSAARDSSTWDEGNHIYSGLRVWAHADYGLNPEHPPLVKLLATAPLLGMHLRVSQPQDLEFVKAAFLGGRTLFIENDADAILWRARLTTAILAIMLALVVFAAMSEMLSIGAGLIALGLLVFEPNILAHSPRVTSDIGVSLFLFATVYAFYRYLKAPSLLRLAVTSTAAGLTLATKHTGLLLFPMLAVLAACELLPGDRAPGQTLGRRALRLAAALATIGVLGILVLWAFHGFRYAARPEGLALNPPLAEYIRPLGGVDKALLERAAAWRLLPESYLQGLAAARLNADGYHSFALGTAYPRRVWFYFPLAFTIKSTLGFLGLVILSVFAVAARRLGRRREVLFLVVPPALYLIVAMSSGMNIGIRHLLPTYTWLLALAGGAAWALARTSRRWAMVAGTLVVLHAASSFASFPRWIPYANEAWGGPSNVHRLLTDSSADWAEQLKSVKRYCDTHGVKEGWFAYFGQGVLEPAAYGIPLRPLPTADTLWIDEPIQVPPAIEGTVLVSAAVLSGFEFGPGPLDPYAQFRKLTPIAVIDHSVFVYQGRFEIPLASALGHAQRAAALLAHGARDAALAEAQEAVRLSPDSVAAQAALGDSFAAVERIAEARAAWSRALDLARTVEPTFQVGWVATLTSKLAPAPDARP
jgi:4-amino-4-deoxy-L-arabinose transferase-like glycosyltransferase